MEEKKETPETESVKEEKVEEVAEVKAPKLEVAPSVIDITPIGEDEPTYVDTIEEARIALHDKFGKTKLISRILSIVVIALLIAALILVVQEPAICKIFGYIIAGVVLVGMLAFYIVTRKQFPNESKNYIKTITTAMNRHIYGDKKYSEVKYDSKEKYSMPDVLADRVYKDVIDIGSRNIVHGRFNNAPFTAGELAIYVAGQKRNSKTVCFLGYYGSRENNSHFEGRYIITKVGKGEKPSDLPTDIDDLTCLFDEDGFHIFGSKDADYKKDLGSKFLSALKAIKVENCFLNLNVVVSAGRTAFYMSYDDSLMGLPFEKPFDPACRNQFTRDLLETLDATELLRE